MRDPSLTSLKLFLTAAEQGSFSSAAVICSMPQSSVTRQMLLLEKRLGCRLFERHRRGVILTAQGRSYYNDIAPAFERIQAATQRIQRSDQDHALRLRVYPTFATNWLISRLLAFRAYAPNISVILDSSIVSIDFDRHNADLAIQFGSGSWKGALAEFLFQDETEPVCTPSFAERNNLEKPRDVAGTLLLRSKYRRHDWLDWFVLNNVPDTDLRYMEFDSSVLTYQACQEGLGIAMGQVLFLKDELAKGSLVRPFSRPMIRSDSGYYLISPANRELPLAARRFRSWLLTVVQEERQ